jgi:hypothetical protein
VNNQKQQGTAYRIWSGDNGDRGGPQVVKMADGGWSDAPTGLAFTNWCIMANELGQSPKILVCPSDDISAAQNFNSTNSKPAAGTFGNAFVSYFVGMYASENYPQSIMGGDRNLCASTGDANFSSYGYASTTPKLITLLTNQNPVKTCWSLKLHSAGNNVGAGNVLIGDGSVQQVSSARFYSDLLTNAADGTPANGGINVMFP